MESIILGYDGSETARSALEWVTQRCRHHDVRATIVEVATAWMGDSQKHEDDIENAAETLREAAPHTRVITARVSGSVAVELADMSQGADLLVLGVRRGARLRSLLTGMLPLRVTVRAKLPVVLVPQGWQARSGSIVVGVDDDDSSDFALDFAIREAVTDGAPLYLVHASTRRPSSSAPRDTSARSPHAVLHSAEQRARAEHADLEVRTALVHDNSTSALAKLQNEAAMIVIGTHGRGPAEGALLNSVGWDLVGQVDVPLAVVPRPA